MQTGSRSEEITLEMGSEKEKGEEGVRKRCRVDFFKDSVVFTELWKLEPWEINNNNVRGLLLAGEDGDGIKKRF